MDEKLYRMGWIIIVILGLNLMSSFYNGTNRHREFVEMRQVHIDLLDEMGAVQKSSELTNQSLTDRLDSVESRLQNVDSQANKNRELTEEVQKHLQTRPQ